MASPYLHALSCSKCGASLQVQPAQQILLCQYCGQAHAFIPPPPRERPGTRYAPGERVAVEWGGHWWSASIREAVGAHEWRIHFDGWNGQWDVVVGPSRIRHISRASRGKGQRSRSNFSFGVASIAAVFFLAVGGLVAFGALRVSTTAPAARSDRAPAPDQPSTPHEYGAGDAVQVEWKGTWYPGKILEVKPGRYKITYEGWSSTWDEWVDATRLRPR